MRLRDRIAIVTGGASGIGAAIARRFAAEGATVIAADIAAPEGPLSGDAPLLSIRVDVSEEASVAAMAEAVRTRFGRIDLLVTSAGIARDIPFLDTPVEVLDRIHAVNVRGTFLCAQACARVMRDAGTGGAIVTIASVSGLRGNSGRAAYGASKGAVVTMTQVMAMDLAPHGIRANVIAPGPIETPMAAAVHTPEVRAAWTRATMLRRYGTPEEVAGAAAFLCSDDAAYITGQVLAVDGGFTAAGMANR
ncbi:MAG TPA: SDR family oxidoreductase [Acetobacteraceae bacterium]|nr:SDR family oxidoreductase [Acetobacteraceae bacterium]